MSKCICGKAIPPYKKGTSGPKKKWCSTKCCQTYRQLDVEAKKPKCICGKPLGKHKTKWCSTKCNIQHNLSNLKKKRIKEKGKLTSKNCKYCGQFFMPKNRRGNVCNKDKCRKKYQSEATMKTYDPVDKVKKVCLSCSKIFETPDIRRRSCGKKKCQEELARLYNQRDHIKIKKRLSSRVRSALLAQRRRANVKDSTWDRYTIDEKAMGKGFSRKQRVEMEYINTNYTGLGTGNYDRGEANFIEKDCIFCGKKFRAMGGASCCSLKCTYKNHNKNRREARPESRKINCKRCGKSFTITKSNATTQLCSNECRELNKKDYEDSLPEELRERRRQRVREKKYNAIKHREIMTRIRSGNPTKKDIDHVNRKKLSTRVRCALKKQKTGLIKKHGTTYELLGCTIEYFREYFKSKFTRGMSWKKLCLGKIHIDHIKPCASFDLTKKSEQKKCFHYTNLQPLWAKDNLRKGAKIAA